MHVFAKEDDQPYCFPVWRLAINPAILPSLKTLEDAHKVLSRHCCSRGHKAIMRCNKQTVRHQQVTLEIMISQLETRECVSSRINYGRQMTGTVMSSLVRTRYNQLTQRTDSRTYKPTALGLAFLERWLSLFDDVFGLPGVSLFNRHKVESKTFLLSLPFFNFRSGLHSRCSSNSGRVKPSLMCKRSSNCAR